MRFEIIYKNGKLICDNYSLGDRELKYTNEYLDKVNRYTKIGNWKNSPVFSLYQPPLATKVGVKMLENRIKRKFQYSRIPASATISITKACQCECDHCSAVFYNHSIEKQLDTTSIIEALKQTVDLGVTTIILLGGEPLLQRDIYKIIHSISSEKANVILFTNGEYLTKENCKKLNDSGLMGAFISIDISKDEEHDALRHRKKLFQKAMIGIENMNQEGMIPGISSYLTPQRIKNCVFQEMVELTKNCGAKEITFFDAIPSGKWLRDESHLLTNEDRIIIKDLVKEYRGKKNYPGLSVQSTMTSKCGSAFCFAANTQFYLSAFGDMCPCDFTPISIGKFSDFSILELWNKMIQEEPYNRRSKVCRMQEPEFRENYINFIPVTGPYPYPLEKIQKNRISK